MKTAAKSLKLPKFRKQESKDNLRHLDVKGRDCQELENIVKRTYVNSEFETVWTLKSAAIVENRVLEERYRAKKAEMKEENRPTADIFVLQAFRDISATQSVVRDGMRCKKYSFNGLGDSKSGVYLWRNADVQFQQAEGWDTSTFVLMIFKVMLGKCKPIPPGSTSDPLIEPTPNYDCHVTQNVAKPSDSLNTKTARSQVYIYEYTEDCEPSPMPRQCLPYAVLVYERSKDAPKKQPMKSADSYSMRPSQRQRPKVSSESKPETETETKSSSYDPVPEPPEPRPQAAYSESVGLCVPRLTAGLPNQRDIPAAVSSSLPLNDPRSQLSFLSSEGLLRQGLNTDPLYNPSFGPSDSDEELDMTLDINALLNKPKMPSLPPIDLPVITDTRQLRDPRIEKLTRDPRLDNRITLDPRQENKPQDSRLQPNIDPRTSRHQDPRLSRHHVPRLNRPATESMKPNDPRFIQDTRNSSGDPRVARDPRQSDPRHSRVSTTETDSSKGKKKLSLHEYKSKAGPEKMPEQKQKAPAVSTPFGDELMEDIDLRQITGPPSSFFEQPLEPHHVSIIMNPNVDAVKNPQSLSSESEREQGKKSSPDIEDIAHEPDDMAKALNELSDPDDASQSPKHIPEPEFIDPILAGAMEKLVQHSGDVSLFTEALKSLQDSADKYGEKLHDPEFLVKKIAEEIEILTAKKEKEERMKAERKKQLEAEQREKARIEAELEKKRLEAELETKRIEQELAQKRKEAEDEKKRIEAEIERKRVEVELARKADEERKEKARLDAIKREEERIQAEKDRLRIEKEKMQAEIERNRILAEMTATVVHVHSGEIQEVEMEYVKELSPEKQQKLDKEKLEGEIERNKILAQMISTGIHVQSGEIEEVEMLDTSDIKSPDAIMSPDHSNDAKYPLDTPTSVKCIPLENEDHKGKSNDRSQLDEVMQRTLAELSKVESGEGEKIGKRKTKMDDTDLTGIPVPPTPPKLKRGANSKADENGSKTSKKMVFDYGHKRPGSAEPPSTKMKGIKDRIGGELGELNDGFEGEDIDLRSGFPVHHNLLPDCKSKPAKHIKFNLKVGSMRGEKNEDIRFRQRAQGRKDHETNDKANAETDQKMEDRHFHSKNFKPASVVDKGSVFGDPFGLGLTEDVDERVKHDRHKHHIGDEDFRSSADNSQTGYQEDFDYRKSHSRSASPPTTTSSAKTDKTNSIKEVKAVSNDSSSSESSNMLFDAYSMNKAKDGNIPHNDFGDVDWRYSAHHGHTDFDMRYVQQQGHADPYRRLSGYHEKSEPFSQLNKSLQNMFGSSQQNMAHNIGHQPKSSQPDPHAGQMQGNVQSWMKQLDFSNLKNIIANVQTPQSSQESQASTSSQQQTTTQPSGSQDSKTEGNPPAVKEAVKADVEIEEPLPSIPGLGGLSGTAKGPGSDNSNGKDGSSDYDFWFTRKSIRSRRSSSEEKRAKTGNDNAGGSRNSDKSGEEKGSIGNKSKNTSSYDNKRDVKDKDNILSTPKNKVRDNDDDIEEFTPLPNISYQSALLESMEQSELKVRHDDDEDETPVKARQKDSAMRKRGLTDSLDESPLIKQQKMDDMEEDVKMEVATSDNDDDEDDEGGLVIDLSPIEKSITTPSPGPDTSKAKQEVKETEKEKVKEEPEKVRNPDEVLIDENRGAPKSKDEMTAMIQNSRKNMVIKLKGETKKVNPETGKIYDEMPKGSAIEVVGQKSTNKQEPSKKDEPIKPVKGPEENRLKSRKSQSSPGPTVCGSISRTPSPITIGSLVRPVPLSLPIVRPIIPQPMQGCFIPTLGMGMGGFVQPVPQSSYVNPYTGQVFTYSSTPGQLAGPSLLQGSNFTTQIQTPIPTVRANPNLITVTKDQCDRMNINQSKCAENQSGQNNNINQPNSNTTGQKIQTIDSQTVSPTKGNAKTDLESKSTGQKRSNSDKTSDVDLKKQKTGGNVGVKTEKESPKKENKAGDNKSKDFGFRILESLDQVKKESLSPTKASKEIAEVKIEPKSEVKIKIEPKSENKAKVKGVVKTEPSTSKKDDIVVIDSGDSELEDGEISDSDSDDNEPVKNDRRVVQDSTYRKYSERHGYGNYPSSRGYSSANEYPSPSKYNHPPHYDSSPNIYQSPKRIVNFRGNYNSSESSYDRRNISIARNVGAQWTDIIENPLNRTEERIRATKIESPSLSADRFNAQGDKDEDILSKSAASINKSKQKILAQSQAKTIGEWLKIELETDNIQPIANIIPYTLDTDLTGISKMKRRKIRNKVKTVIEEEGLKRAKEDQGNTEVVQNYQPAKPSYSPEIHNDELEAELNFLREASEVLKGKVMNLERNNFQPHPGNERMSLLNSKRVIAAMTLVEGEMKQLLFRTTFFGYPHRKVPEELLLDSEKDQFKSSVADVFLILMMPISAKPYYKLIELKAWVEELSFRLSEATTEQKMKELQEEIDCENLNRQSLLRSFTGYLNKKRITKIQETTDKYTMVYEYFKSLVPTPPDSKLKYIRTTQMDLRQHLILAKQYLAMEETKKNIVCY